MDHGKVIPFKKRNRNPSDIAHELDILNESAQDLQNRAAHLERQIISHLWRKPTATRVRDYR